MLCKTCGEDNTIGRENCWKCHSPLAEKSKEATAAPATKGVASEFAAKIWALVFAVAAYMAFQEVAPLIFERPSGGGINIFRSVCSGAIVAASWVVGFKIGKWFNSSPSK